MSEALPNKAFVDTSILADVLLQKNDSSRRALARFETTQLPEFAIKEFKAGPLRYWVWTHNKLVDAESFELAVDAIRRVWRQPNRLSSALEAISIGSKEFQNFPPGALQAYGPDASLDAIIRDRLRLALASRVRRAWKRRRAVTSEVVVPLTCYEETAPFERRGRIEIRPTTCSKDQDCCLAAEMKRRPGNLRKLRQASAKLPPKTENTRRAQALRELIRKPKQKVDDKTCRALGDAVFAFFAPSDAVVLTTNLKDHGPLAEALGKRAITPSELDEDSEGTGVYSQRTNPSDSVT